MLQRISMRLHHLSVYYSALLIADYSYVCMSTPWVNSETPYSCPSLQQILTEFIPLLSFNANFSQFAWNARINGLGWPSTAERTFREKMCFVEPTRKNWMKIDPYYQRQKFRSMILLSRNIGFFGWLLFSETLEIRIALLYCKAI